MACVTAAEKLINLANASGGPDNITAIIIQVSDRATLEEATSARNTKSADDTNPSIRVSVQKPQTLPEGKYHTDKNK